MPIYEFVCQACGANFDKLVRPGNTAGKIECPSCKSEDVQRKVSVCSSMAGSQSGSRAGGSSGSSGCGCG